MATPNLGTLHTAEAACGGDGGDTGEQRRRGQAPRRPSQRTQHAYETSQHLFRMITHIPWNPALSPSQKDYVMGPPKFSSMSYHHL